MGATCVKIEPPAAKGAPRGSSGDPMGRYNPAAYKVLHDGVRVKAADLKTPAGQAVLQRELAKADVLLTSFRPSALPKLGLAWKSLHARYPSLCQIAIVGAHGDQAEAPGHDLTYLAEKGLVTSLEMPPTLYADMGGAQMATEAILQAALYQRERYAGSGDIHPKGVFREVALSEAAAWAALPRRWGLTLPTGAVGGAHAGYRVYACRDGRVAVAALEPHFAAALCQAAGLGNSDMGAMFNPATREGISRFLAGQTCTEIDRLARDKDLPLHTMKN